MASVTDIPDWCATEGGVPLTTPLEPAAYGTLFSMSPASRVDSIRAPVLIALGLKDRRVPPSQGVDFYHALKKRGKHVEMLTYPDDDHALDTSRTNADHWVEIADFLRRAFENI